MNPRTILFFLTISLLLYNNTRAQDTISLQEAIEIGLEQNFGIRIAKNEAEISSINNSLGEAGFLPSLELNGEYSTIEDHFDINDRTEATTTELEERSTYSGVQVALNWSIFQGGWKITNYRKLRELEKLGELQANIAIENTVLDIAAAYHNILNHKKRIEVLNNSVEISEDRKKIAETKYDLGAGSEYDLLVTTTDLNVDRTEVIRERRMLYNAQMELIELLNLASNSKFEVESNIELMDLLSIEELQGRVLENNRQLSAARMRTKVAELEKREVRSERLPEISLGAAYNLSNEDLRENSLHSVEKRDGFFYGATARLNLFDGFRNNRRAKIAEINIRNSEIEEEAQKKTIETLLLSNYSDYRAAVDLIALEESNLELARKALDIAFERFRLGNITPVELRESQRTLLNTETRLITATFEAKIYETELLRLSGSLLEEYNIAPL